MPNSDETLEETRSRHGPPYRGISLRAILAVLVAVLLLTAGAVLSLSRPAPRTTIVEAAASQVLLNVSDIPQVGWGEWDSGSNGTGAWRFFAVHNELILATLNVTLWVEADADAARGAMDGIGRGVPYPSGDGGIPGADASLFWTFDFGQYAGMIVRRYNVVFLLAAHLESSFALTKSDLARWSGWQLTKIEAYAV